MESRDRQSCGVITLRGTYRNHHSAAFRSLRAHPYGNYGFSLRAALIIVHHHTKVLAAPSSKALRSLPDAR